MEEKIIIQDVEKERYVTFSFIPWWDQEKIKASRIMIVGAGALGNELLKNLALIGIGNIFIIDFDKIVNADLTRAVLYRLEDEGKSKVVVAAKRIHEINPDVNVQYFCGDVVWDVGLGLFRRMDVIIGCVDNREARLAINQACWHVNKPWIDGGIDVLNGVVNIFIPNKGACYECTLTEIDYKILNVRYSCPFIPYQELLTGKVPTTPTTSAIIAGLQVQELLKLIHDMDVPSGKGIIFNGFTYELYVIKYPEKEKCLSHEKYENIIEIDCESENTTFKKLLEMGKEYLGEEDVILELDRDIVVQLRCKVCKYRKSVNKVLNRVTLKEGECPNCKITCQLDMKYIITKDDEQLLNKTLEEVGIPLLHIITLRGNNTYCRFELSRDERKIFDRWG